MLKNFLNTPKYIIFLVVLVVGLFWQKVVYSQTSINVSFKVGSSDLTLSGLSAPNSSVVIKENGAVLGTTQTDGAGNFTKELLALEEGIHKIEVYSVDPKGSSTPSLVYSIAISGGSATTLSIIYLPATIKISDSSADIGDEVDLSGYAIPGSVIKIYINDELYVKFDSSLEDGSWDYTLDTSDFPKDEYEIYAIAVYGLSELDASDTKTLDISGGTIAETEQTLLEDLPERIIVRLLLNPIIQRFPFIDKDSSGRIEAEELYDAVKYWVDNWRSAESKDCDLNSDVRCNLIDLSVLLYYIER